jgi:hypothetical protein
MVSKASATFQDIVKERADGLRELTFHDLEQLADAPTEHMVIDSRPAKTSIIVLRLAASGGLRVVVQGFLKARFLGWHVSLDGFYRYPDETSAALTREDMWDYS